MATNFVYSDINTYVGVNGKSEVVFQENAIINSILNLILCVPRSRKFRSKYGSKIHYYLQEPATQSNADNIKSVLTQEIEVWQPYADVDTVETTVTPVEGGLGYNLNIVYRSKLSGFRSTVSLKVLQNRLPNNG